MPTIEATTTTTQTIALKPLLARKLRVELKAYQDTRMQFKALEAKLDKHKATLGGLREQTGEQSLSFEGFKITQVTGVSTKLDKKKLLEAGVTMAQLEEGTITTPKRPYELVSCPEEKLEEF